MKNTELTSERVYSELLNKIMQGSLYPGVHLVESELVTEFSASRTTIREVLRRLTEDGLIEQIPHKGVRVRALSVKEVTDYYQIVKMLEGNVAYTVALNHTEAQLQELESILAEDELAVENNNIIAHQESIRHFRATLASFTGNAPLFELIVKIHRIIALYCITHYATINMTLAHEDHKKLLSAIRMKDPILAKVTMKSLIQTSLELLSI